MIYDQPEDRVNRGIAILNEKYGPDWFKQINLDKLNMLSCLNCVLGQIYGEYEDGLKVLDLISTSAEKSVNHGFTASYGMFMVERLWVEKIKALKEEVKE